MTKCALIEWEHCGGHAVRGERHLRFNLIEQPLESWRRLGQAAVRPPTPPSRFPEPRLLLLEVSIGLP